MSTPAEIQAFLDAYLDNWNAPGDRLAEVFHPGGTLEVPGQTEPWSVDQVRRFVAAVKRGMPDLRLRILHWAERDHQLFTEWEMSGTLGGRAVAWTGINRNHLRGAASLGAVSHWDPSALLEQVEPDRPGLDLLAELARLQTGPGRE